MCKTGCVNLEHKQYIKNNCYKQYILNNAEINL